VGALESGSTSNPYQKEKGEKSKIQSSAVVIYSGIPMFRTTLGKVRLIGWFEKRAVKGLKNRDSTV